MFDELFFTKTGIQTLAECVCHDYKLFKCRKTHFKSLFYIGVVCARLHTTVFPGGNVAVNVVMTDHSESWPSFKEKETDMVGVHYNQWPEWPLLVMKKVLYHLKLIKPVRIDCITAHGLAGAVAQLLGLELDKPVVTFGAPGVVVDFLAGLNRVQLHFVGNKDERVLQIAYKHVGIVRWTETRTNNMIDYYRAVMEALHGHH